MIPLWSIFPTSRRFFPEKRPFFIEGQDIFRFGRGGVNNNWSFNYGDPNHFYTRRIGRSPQVGTNRGYDYIDSPSGTTILGAAKLSGKLTKEWSIGMISAVTAREYAQLDTAGERFRDEIEPLSSYNVIRARREYDEGRHGLGMIGSFMSRDLRTDNLRNSLTSFASVWGMDGWFTFDKEGVYVMSGWLGRSKINGATGVISDIQSSSPHYFQRPDVTYLGVDTAATSMTGYGGRLYLNKQKGNVIFNSGLAAIAPSYEVNDLGFQWNADQINWHVALGYKTFDPGKYFRSTFFTVATFRNWDFGGNTYGIGHFLFANIQLLNYWSFNLDGAYFPESVNKGLTRGGVLAKSVNSGFVSFSANSDGRKDLSYSIGLQHGRATRQFTSLQGELEWKPNASLNLSVSPRYSIDVTEGKWVGTQADPLATGAYGTRYLFAETIEKSVSLGTRLNWSFSPTLSLQFYAQPLIFAIDYFDYKELAQPKTYNFNIYGKSGDSTIEERLTDDGIVYEVDPDGSGPAAPFEISDQDFNFKSLRGNMVLRWEYRPGSVFYLAWTQFRSDDASTGVFDLGANTRDLLAAQGDNILLVKFTYWIAP